MLGTLSVRYVCTSYTQNFSLDLPTQSPLLYNATKVLLRWEQLLTARLETYPITESLIEYIPTLDEDGVARGGMALQRMKILLNPENTPFRLVLIIYSFYILKNTPFRLV